MYKGTQKQSSLPRIWHEWSKQLLLKNDHKSVFSCKTTAKCFMGLKKGRVPRVDEKRHLLLFYYWEKGKMIASHTWSKKTPKVCLQRHGSQSCKKWWITTLQMAQSVKLCIKYQGLNLESKKDFRKVKLWMWRNFRTLLANLFCL